ncbi:16S rRNA (uracil(1498)-N(3))-methyltransferase [Pseudemcibacter aquimaris]|uniref:16S rRNA (uracil(1498)-N(3))-methyltransferase n=1 Tax=Pseudemcibacter aquimaris TaxID=2857064 RepID=UPI0020138859|nr:16S rRNA (uracil(1498)-N(3))-methyltransferase [Pseudemcibacter aquimaris]MCC3862313.1 16S rRNA (uracil(1498)-N(3))-methyltransferase [Pseudemcibacter aquimaris]WDU59061.1 16S rRNA (uracil(1498)-N(3))-methyltransferase [Pseudemcibacter aquimaris]
MSNKSSRTRLFINEAFIKGSEFLVDGNQGHYLVNVLRVREGELVTLFNGDQGEWHAEITKVKKGKAFLVILDKVADQTSDPDLWYIFAPVKKARVDYMIQKATELGVGYIRPVMTQHTNLDRIKDEKIIANMIEAAEQCGRMTVPQLDVMTSLDDLLENWPDDRGLIFCDEAGDAKPFIQIEKKFDKWAILIGPEGGFSAEERALIREHQNSIPVTLGPRILRADTAAVAAISLWQSYIGDWQHE